MDEKQVCGECFTAYYNEECEWCGKPNHPQEVECMLAFVSQQRSAEASTADTPLLITGEDKILFAKMGIVWGD